MVNVGIQICRALYKRFYMLNYLVPKLNILLWQDFRDGKRPDNCCQLTVAQKNDILVFDASRHKTFENLCVMLWNKHGLVFAGSL